MSLELLQRSVGWVIAFGIVLILLGMLAILAPLVAGIAVDTLVGVLFFLGGVAEIVYALRAHTWGGGLLSFASGGLSIACGLLMLLLPLVGLSFLTLLLAAYFFADGISRIVLALQARTLPGWQWMLVNGAVTLALAALILADWPLSGIWAIGVLVGINILLTGWALIASGLAAKKLLAAR